MRGSSARPRVRTTDSGVSPGAAPIPYAYGAIVATIADDAVGNEGRIAVPAKHAAAVRPITNTSDSTRKKVPARRNRRCRSPHLLSPKRPRTRSNLMDSFLLEGGRLSNGFWPERRAVHRHH